MVYIYRPVLILVPYFLFLLHIPSSSLFPYASLPFSLSSFPFEKSPSSSSPYFTQILSPSLSSPPSIFSLFPLLLPPPLPLLLPFPSFPPRLFPLHHLFLSPISLLRLPHLPSSSPFPRTLLLPFPLSPSVFPSALPLPFPFLHPRVPHEWRHEGSGCHFFGLLRRRRRE